MKHILTIALCIIGFLVGANLAGAQGSSDIIRGKVTDNKGNPIAGAQVTVTDSAGPKRTVRTNNEGRYTALFQSGSGRYIVSVLSMGMAPAQRSVVRAGDEAVLLGDVTMNPVSAATAIDEVKVVGRQRQKADRERDGSLGVGAKESGLGSMIPGDGSDLNKLAGGLPGVRMTGDGFSVLGAGANQNTMTLNGMSMAGTVMPTGVASVTMATTSFDPSVGGFSGGRISATVRPGDQFKRSSLSVSLDAPAFQATTPAAVQLGQKYGDIGVNYAHSGELIEDRAFYNGGLRYGRHWSDLNALGMSGLAAVTSVGLSPDSLARLTQLLHNAGVPTAPSRSIGSVLNTSLSALYRFDVTPPESNHSLNLVFSGSRTKSEGGGASPSTFLTRASGSEGTTMSFGVEYSAFLKEAFLHEIKTSVSRSNNSNSPYLRMPSAQVLISSDLPDGSRGSSYVGFGGSSASSSSNDWTWQLNDELSWFSLDNKHRFKLAGAMQLTGLSNSSTSNLLGSYSYNSLADFEAGTPTSFTRTLDPVHSSARSLNTTVSIGDAWRPRNNVQFQYGLRLDADRFLDQPKLNAALDLALGVKTNRVPNSMFVSPRLGFSWLAARSPESVTDFTKIKQLFVSGGIGVFRYSPTAGMILGPMAATGLNDGPRQLSCIGSVIPTPNWSSLADPANVPDECLNGTTPSVFANQAPYVQFFDQSFTPSRSWRSNLGMNYVSGLLNFQLSGLYSLSLAQQSVVDANFNNTVRFVLPDETGRPVYAAPSDIVGNTGAIALSASRRVPAYSTVNGILSDGRSVAKQFSVSASPGMGFLSRGGFHGMYVMPSLTYTLGSERSLLRGFDGANDGDPNVATWGRGAGDVRHTLQFNLMIGTRHAGVQLQGMLRSGTPYTPMVSGDISGDGLSNDRAFVFDPAHIADPDFKAAMTNLLSTADRRTRDCLSSQLGRIAARNSCTGPWSKSLDLTATLEGRTVGLGERVRFYGSFTNLLGGMDQLMHGGTNLRGWGSTPYTDPTLLIVRGFDAGNQRFVYDVNPRFGTSSYSRALSMTPFRLTLTASIELSPNGDVQFTRFTIRKALKAPDSVTAVANIQGSLVNQGVGTMVLHYVLNNPRDTTITLSEEQKKQLGELRAEFSRRADSLAKPIAEYVVQQGRKFTDETVDRVKSYRKTVNAMYAKEFSAKVVAILKPDQFANLPEPTRDFIMAKDWEMY